MGRNAVRLLEGRERDKTLPSPILVSASYDTELSG